MNRRLSYAAEAKVSCSSRTGPARNDACSQASKKRLAAERLKGDTALHPGEDLFVFLLSLALLPESADRFKDRLALATPAPGKHSELNSILMLCETAMIVRK